MNADPEESCTDSIEIPDWPTIHEVRARGTIRQTPEDFQVTEISICEPDGEGEHVWLRIGKRLLNTDEVAGRIAKLCDIPRRDVGYAGLKDRNAVTEQWFSVRLPGADPDWSQLEGDNLHILENRRHSRKLKTGALRGNRFRIVIRNLEGDLDHVEAVLDEISKTGVPNYFGPQRFGRDGNNVQSGLDWLRGDLRKVSKFKRGIYISALRSFLFNEILAQRVSDGTWNQPLLGDLMQLDGSHSVFSIDEPDDAIFQRAHEKDIHPTGPLWGKVKEKGNPYERELFQLSQWVEMMEGLEKKKVAAARRSLRCLVSGLEWGLSGDDLELTFELPAGCYATSVLREVVYLYRC